MASQYLVLLDDSPLKDGKIDQLVRPGIAPLQHALELLVRPRIQVDRFDATDMCAHSTMYTGASRGSVRHELAKQHVRF